MTAYVLFEILVITMIVGFSANRVVRQYMPGTHRQARRWIASRLGLKLRDEPAAVTGCGSGCNSCATGCSTGSTGANSGTSTEQPLRFHPRKT